VAPTLLEIAEAPGAYVVPRHPSVVVGDGWVFLQLGPSMGAVQRIRVAEEELEAARHEVRSLAAARELSEVGWWVSELTPAPELGRRLGLEHRETLTALALERPFDADGGFEVREVTTLDDYVTAQTIDAVANDWPVAERERYVEMWDVARERFLMWLALDDGRPVGMARSAVAGDALVLIGGSVLPDARGRGAYRSLVAARWRSATDRGLGALVTAANTQSGPILTRLGFEPLGEIQIWVDGL